jgi:hypothetical protein
MAALALKKKNGGDGELIVGVKVQNFLFDTMTPFISMCRSMQESKSKLAPAHGGHQSTLLQLTRKTYINLAVR